MRIATGLSLVFVAAFALQAANPKERKGVRTPGIQIPFSTLKVEMDFETAPNLAWIGVADTVLVANPAKDGLVRIDTRAKEKKLAEPIAGIKQPCAGVVSAFDSLWVGNCGDGALVRVDSKTAKATATIATG